MDSNNKQNQIDRDYICPVCFKATAPAVAEPESYSDGICRRSYSVWCPECSAAGQGFIVLQFRHGGRWRIEKYIPIKPLYIYDGPWQAVQQALPMQQEVPLIQTGPGGDFAISTSDEKMTEALKSYNDLLVQLAGAGHQLVDVILNRKSNLENRK